MSQARHAPKLTVEQEPFLIVRSFATQYASGYCMHEHQHSWRQLLYAVSGAMTVRAGRWSWIVPPGRAVVIPAACRHSMRMWGEVAMRSLDLSPDLTGAGQHAGMATTELAAAGLASAGLAAEECCVISVTPLLRELILRVI